MCVRAFDYAPDRKIALLALDHDLGYVWSLAPTLGLRIEGSQANVGTRIRSLSVAGWLSSDYVLAGARSLVNGTSHFRRVALHAIASKATDPYSAELGRR